MQEQLPGLTVHINEGRLLGTFELPPADMQQIRYHGRNVIVIVADAEKVGVADTKDGDTKASWTFKAVDAAIVRDRGMIDHLAEALYLDGLEDLTLPRLIVGEARQAIVIDPPEGVDIETGEIERGHTWVPDAFDGPADELGEDLDSTAETDDKPVEDERVFRVTTDRPIQNKDPMLERFLNERVPSGL